MKFGVVVFPGSDYENDTITAIRRTVGQQCEGVFYDATDLSGFDAIILPGDVSYGDYLRPGALAAGTPVIQEVKRFAAKGGPVLGIDNGFSVLLEAGLLPGAFLPNDTAEFCAGWVSIKVENSDTIFTGMYKHGETLRMPVAKKDLIYYLPQDELRELEASGRVIFRYANSAIAGILNKSGNVLGLMPRPDRCVDSLTGGEDGKRLFQSLADRL